MPRSASEGHVAVSEEDKANVVRRTIKGVWNGDGPDAADELVAQDVVVRATVAEHRRGIEGPGTYAGGSALPSPAPA